MLSCLRAYWTWVEADRQSKMVFATSYSGHSMTRSRFWLFVVYKSMSIYFPMSEQSDCRLPPRIGQWPLMLYNSLRNRTLTPSQLGLPNLSHPPKRRNRLFHLRRYNRLDKPRQHHRSKRHSIPHPLRFARILHPQHRLHPQQTPPWRTSPTCALVPRPHDRIGG